MARPEEVLSDTDYRNYCNVRAVALLFIVLGGIFVLGGLANLAESTKKPNQPRQQQQQEKPLSPVVALFLTFVGVTGIVGGIATRSGQRQWAPLIKVMAFLYLLGFPLGTFLSFVLLNGFSRYFKSVERIRRADYDDDEDEDEDEKPSRSQTPWARNAKRKRRVEEDEEDEDEEEDEKPPHSQTPWTRGARRRKPRDDDDF